ncbi:unnamed protein product [Peronospora farinosa]|uniref:Uncharacterized protein n=1 Tax=Peronospora farinosa TaxID=134698 RepID=A0AAV0UTW1_9STRA|nr:unnamed protein product [Peronospora farinosa]CAI5740360.1 unnamed protein product [Peronospora farinosa]
MPVTRGRARMMENEEEDVEEEPSQQMQESQDELEQQAPTTMEEPKVVNLKDMAKQLTNTLKHLLTTHRQLENDAAMIQAGIDELHRMQEDRAERIVKRLKNASSTILTFGDANEDAHRERPEHDGEDYEDEMMN